MIMKPTHVYIDLIIIYIILTLPLSKKMVSFKVSENAVLDYNFTHIALTLVLVTLLFNTVNLFSY